jgi:hypothetical protein
MVQRLINGKVPIGICRNVWNMFGHAAFSIDRPRIRAT